MHLIPNADTEMVLAQLCYTLRLGSQLADSPMHRNDGYLAQLKELGLFHRTIMLGPVIVSRPYGIDGPSDSGQMVQAALTTDFGSAAIFWDSEDYFLAKESDDFEAEALDAARPLQGCVPAIRSVIWPHIPSLVHALLDQISIE